VLADGDEVSLQLMLANDGDERLLYLDMPENMSWSVNTTYAEAAIVSVGEPRLFQPPGDAPSEMTFYEVDIVTEYTLTGYEKAVLVINAEHQVPSAGSSVTSNSLTIQEGSSTSTSTMIFAEDYFDENGVLLPDTTITAMINLYDEETSTYTNLYPGDVELPPEMASAPPPISPDRIRIDAITLADPLLNISLNYNLESSPTATLTLDSTAATAVAAVEPIPVSAGEDSMTLSMPADSLQSGTPLTLTAVLEGDNVSANDVLTLRLSDFENDTLDDLWIAHVNVITDTTVPAFNAMLEITLGYNLNETFSDGEIRYSVRSLSNNANGGGGGGGGGWPIPTGLGVVTIPLFVPLPEDDANVSISLQFELTGTAVTDTGTETQTLTTLTPSLDELLPDN
jgi:hypothetical protein